MRSKVKNWLWVTAGTVVLAGITAFVLVWNGIVLLNGFSADRYEVRGVDVSHYQGVIDWQVLAGQDVDFAFIKATEGSSHVDERFAYNIDGAKNTDIAAGAYHFFSFDSKGDTQADNFISAVTPFDGMLPPVVDFEFYGNKADDPPKKEDVSAELQIMLDRLEERYGTKPIIYATEETYRLYLSGGYGEYDIWIRNVITRPKVSDGRDWTFWQYTNRGRLDGYNGEERYIDINVFRGTAEEFSEYLNDRCCRVETSDGQQN